MTRSTLDVRPPFFEVGPKAYCFGAEIVRIAERADQLSVDWGVDILLTPQYVDIPRVAQAVKHARVFAQHMDALLPGRGTGSVLPEALKEAGAAGVLLNHVERPLEPAELARTIERADSVGLATMVCADNAAQAEEIARLSPHIIIVESPDLIASTTSPTTDPARIPAANEAIWRVDPRIRVLHAAGIVGPRDVYNVIAAGAQGSGSSSAMFTADNPDAVLEAMVQATRQAFDDRKERRASS